MMVAVGPGRGAESALATGSAALSLCPSLVAVIVAAPAATPVTSPLADTVATALWLVVQLTVRPVGEFPAESFVTAASCTVAPTCRLPDAGLTVTDAPPTGSPAAAAA